jgi:hypothetical protein
MNSGSAPLSQPRYNLDTLNGRVASKVNGPNNGVLLVEPARYRMNGFAWFVIILLVVGLLLFLFRPIWVLSVNPQTSDLQVDWGKLILWSLLITVVVLAAMWLLRGFHGLIAE